MATSLGLNTKGGWLACILLYYARLLYYYYNNTILVLLNKTWGVKYSIFCYFRTWFLGPKITEKREGLGPGF